MSNKSIVQLLEQGKVFTESGNLHDALAIYDDVLYREPDNVQALTGKGVIFLAQTQYEAAIECLKQVTESDNPPTKAVCHLIDAYLGERKVEGANQLVESYHKELAQLGVLADYRQKITGTYRSTDLLTGIQQAEEQIRKANLSDARVLLRRLRETHGDDPVILNDLGIIALQEELYGKGCELILQAFQADHTNVDIKENLVDLVSHEPTLSLIREKVRSLVEQSVLHPGERESLRLLTQELQMDTPYQCATVSADITPEIAIDKPVPLQGFTGKERQANKIITPLAMQLTLIQDSDLNCLVLVSADIFGFASETVEEIRNILKPWGVPPESIILNASHTHYGPGTKSGLPDAIGPYDSQYSSMLVDVVNTLMEMAYDRLKPCYLYAGKTHVRIGVNRRLPEKNGTRFGPNPEGFYDESTPALTIHFVESDKKTVLVNHGCHPTGINAAPAIFADFPIFFREYCGKKPDIQDAVFLQGAAGDIKEAVSYEDTIRFTSAVEEVMQNGQRLGGAVSERMNKPLMLVRGTLKSGVTRVNLPLKTGNLSEEIESLSESGTSDPLVNKWAKKFQRKKDYPTELTMEIQVVSVGGVFGMITLPGEPLAALGHKMKNILADVKVVMLLGYTNGLTSYLPTTKQICEGGYEVDDAKYVYSLPGKFTEDIEPILCNGVAETYQKSKNKSSAQSIFNTQAFFTMSSGRCGTKTLSEILSIATNAEVYHHPRPYLIKETLNAYHGIGEMESTFLSGRKGVIKLAQSQGKIFGEIDHNMTPFTPMLSKRFPNSRFIVLVRNPWDFVRSGMRRNYYQGHPWDKGRLRPDPSHPDCARWQQMSPFEKVCWLWGETYRRILGYLEDIPEDRYMVVRFEDLVADPEVSRNLFNFLALENFDKQKINSILETPLNKQTSGEFPEPEDWNESQHRVVWQFCEEPLRFFNYQNMFAKPPSISPRYQANGSGAKPSLLFLEQEGLSTGGHLEHIIPGMKSDWDVSYLKTTNLADAARAIEQTDVVWLEWASELSALVTQKVKQLNEKPTVCRLHGFEVFSELPQKFNWDVVNKLIFVAEHKRELFAKRFPDLEVSDIVIRNGINLDQFSIPDNKTNTKNLLLLGHLNYRKGLPLLLQFYHELLQRDEEYHLYIRGDWQDRRYKMAVLTMIEELNLTSHLTFVGEWIEDLNSWLADKSHILSFSLEESFHYAIGNGMAAGMKPIIHAWNESRKIWPGEFIFRNLDEFLQLFTNDKYEPTRYRELIVERHLTGQDQVQNIRGLIADLHDSISTAPKMHGHAAYNHVDQTSNLHQNNGQFPRAGNNEFRLENGSAGTIGTGNGGEFQNTRKIKEWYEDKYAAKKQNSYRNRYSYKPIVDLLHIGPQDTVLDIGSGQGYAISWAEERSPHVYGVDISQNALTVSKTTSKHIQVIQAMGEFLPFKDATFTRLLCNGVLEHFQSLESGLSEFYRVLKPGSIALINVPNSEYRFWTDNQMGTAQQEIQEALHTQEEWKEYIISAGFNIIEIRSDNFIAPWPHRIPLEESYQLLFLCNKGSIQLDPDNGPAEDRYSDLINKRLTSNDPFSAYALLKQLVGLYPDHKGILNAMGNVCQQMGREDEAEGYFTDVHESIDHVRFQHTSGKQVHMKIIPGDHISRVLQSGKFYESEMLEFIHKKMGSGKNIIDIGGHIGNHTVYWGKIAEANSISVFEPNPNTRNILEQNVKLNNLKQVQVYPYAIGEAESRGTINESNKKNTGSARVLMDPRGEVRIRSLDQIVSAPVDLIKIDVEGMAGEVLKGAASVIIESRPVLLVECGNAEEYESVIGILNMLGYEPKRRFNSTPTLLFEFTGHEIESVPDYNSAIAMTA